MSALPESRITNPNSRLSICLVCSHGGHLSEMMQLADVYSEHDVFYFCYDAATTRRLPDVTLIPNRPYSPIEFVKNLLRVRALFKARRPDLVLSTGAEIAIPVLLIAKLMRVPSLYIECGAQFTTPSVTGRISYWLCDRFYVQWPELLAAYGARARYVGSLIDERLPATK